MTKQLAYLSIIVFLYIIIANIQRSWNPRLWLSQPYHEFRIINSYQDWGKLGLDLNLNGDPLEILNKTFSRGLGTHAYSSVELLAPIDTKFCSGSCGIDKSAGGKGAVKCFVIQKDEILFQSEVLYGTSPQAPFKVAFDPKLPIFLQVDAIGATNTYAHVDWIELRAER